MARDGSSITRRSARTAPHRRTNRDAARSRRSPRRGQRAGNRSSGRTSADHGRKRRRRRARHRVNVTVAAGKMANAPNGAPPACGSRSSGTARRDRPSPSATKRMRRTGSHPQTLGLAPAHGCPRGLQSRQSMRGPAPRQPTPVRPHPPPSAQSLKPPRLRTSLVAESCSALPARAERPPEAQ